ncbi:MAG: HypC/HybG/HupF family hydrogenase formation chaperone [Nitrospinae bacterium]|nr:HypC/HybG/HupF family hydrogenase formation chaperone [Nitrospinota bacterium]
MCLGIPVQLIGKDGDIGICEIAKVKRRINLQLIEEAEIGDYLILHAGFAIQRLDEKEASEILRLLYMEDMGD